MHVFLFTSIFKRVSILNAHDNSICKVHLLRPFLAVHLHPASRFSSNLRAAVETLLLWSSLLISSSTKSVRTKSVLTAFMQGLVKVDIDYDRCWTAISAFHSQGNQKRSQQNNCTYNNILIKIIFLLLGVSWSPPWVLFYACNYWLQNTNTL